MTDESLAQRIRGSSSSLPVDAKLRTDQRVLARITDGIYRQPSSALRELISNAYDADATEVTIHTDAPRFSFISVRDNGTGLTPESLQHLIEHIGGSAKRTIEGAALAVTAPNDPFLSPGGRQLIGKLGIGLFSVAQFTRHFLIITKTPDSNFRTVADVTLGHSEDQASTPAISPSGQPDIQTGRARIWVEKVPKTDQTTCGTEIKLLDLLPRTRDELASLDHWGKIDFEVEADGQATTHAPRIHIGRMSRSNPDDYLVQPSIPWLSSDSPRKRFEKLVEAVRDLAVDDRDLVDLTSVCDHYLQTVWTLALAAPLPYIDGHPFDLDATTEVLHYQLQNTTRGQTQPLELKRGQTIRDALNLSSPSLRKGDRFDVTIDGMQLFRPISFLNQPTTAHAVKTPLLCVGHCREDFKDKPVSLSGGPLEFEAYVFWTPKVVPSQHQGVLIRVGNASGAPFDRTFMGYQISEQTRLRQITAEIFVRVGLDNAINIDRESFNYAHPHYQFLVKWLHSALRQLTNRHKEVGKTLRGERLAKAGKQAKKKLEKMVEDTLRDRGVDDVPTVVILQKDDHRKASDLRRKGTIVLRRETTVPPGEGDRTTSASRERSELIERKAMAVAQVLKAWGLMDNLSFAEQEQLVNAILKVTTLEVAT